MRERLFAEPITRLRARRRMPRRWKCKLLAVVLALLASWLLSGCGASEPTNAAGGVVLVIVCVATALAVVFAVRKQRENEEEERSLLLVPGSSLGGGKIVFMPFDEGSHAIRAVVDDLKANQRVIEYARRSGEVRAALEALELIHGRNAAMIEVLLAVVESRDVAAAEADRSVRGPFAEVPVMMMAGDGWNDGVWGVWALGVIFLAGVVALVWLVVHLRANARFVEELRRSQVRRRAALIAARRALEDESTVVEVSEFLVPGSLLRGEAVRPFTVGPLECLSEPFYPEPEGRSVSCPHPQCDDPLAEGKEPS